MKERDRGSPFQYPTVENVGFSSLAFCVSSINLTFVPQFRHCTCCLGRLMYCILHLQCKQPLCLLKCFPSPSSYCLQQIESIIRHQKPIRRERKNSSSSSTSSSSSAHSPTIPSQHSISQRNRRQHTTVRDIGDPHSAPPTPPPRLDSPQPLHPQPRAWKSLPRVGKRNCLSVFTDSSQLWLSFFIRLHAN